MARLNSKARKKQILNAAVSLAVKVGYSNIRRDDVAKNASVSTGLINRYFTTIMQLKNEVMRYAIRNEILQIIAEGIVLKDPQALKVPNELKIRALMG